tara:strand:+ start:96 stop:434 length:339 start_codon:yes stop_codon:yes gene_type:complete
LAVIEYVVLASVWFCFHPQDQRIAVRPPEDCHFILKSATANAPTAQLASLVALNVPGLIGWGAASGLTQIGEKCRIPAQPFSRPAMTVTIQKRTIMFGVAPIDTRSVTADLV